MVRRTDDGDSSRLVTQTCCGRRGKTLEEELTEGWSRRDDGSVMNRRAFDAHMAQVGEEDQSQPGWDSLP